MELKSSSKQTGLSSSDYTSDPEKEISEGEDEDDDRNHKHRRRESGSQSLEGDFLNQVMTRPYMKRKPFENGYSYREEDPQSGETWKNHSGALERGFPSRFEKRRSNKISFSRAPLDLNQKKWGSQSLSSEAGPGRGRVMESLSWSLHDSMLGLVDVASQMVQSGPIPSGLLAGRGLPNISDAQSTSWNAFGLVPGASNGVLDGLHPFSLQGALRPSINPGMNIGISRQRCRDFEERGFCLSGDMCPMEHGVNRIVIEDVQSLSRFNLPVSLPGSQLLGTAYGNGTLPLISAPSGSLVNTKVFHATSSKPGITEVDSGLNGGFVGGSDVYDPDQPLWTTDTTETSAAPPAINELDAGDTEAFLDMNRSDQKYIESYEGYDEGPVRSSANAVSHSFPVLGKLGTSKDRLGQKEKFDSAGRSTSSERDIKSEEARSTGLQDVSHQGKWMNVDDNGPQVRESSLNLHKDSVSNVRKPSQKAFCTLFVNGIPLKDNKREGLLSHFQKFGEVIDIHIPMHSQRAFVQFSRRKEAEAALKAPDAIMGNRFIKLWWANRDNTNDYGIIGTSDMQITPGRVMRNAALSHPPVPDRGKENPHSTGDKDGNAHASVAQVPVSDLLKPMITNVPKAPPLQQKKLENLEFLKEELRKKQEMLDQKRNEFRRQLDKLEKQSGGFKDVTVSDQSTKTLKDETLPDHTKTETFKSSPRANLITENTRSADHAMSHASISNPTVTMQELSSLRPSIRPLAPRGAPFVVNRFKLDNRPTAFRTVAPLPDGLANISTLEEHFSTYGNLSSVELEESKHHKTNDASVPPDVSACISFTTRHSAERAFLYGKCWQGHSLQFMWLTSINSCKEGGGSGRSASSNVHSDANVQPGTEADATQFQKSAILRSDEPENMTREKSADSVKRDKDSESISNSFSIEKKLSCSSCP